MKSALECESFEEACFNKATSHTVELEHDKHLGYSFVLVGNSKTHKTTVHIYEYLDRNKTPIMIRIPKESFDLMIKSYIGHIKTPS